MVQGRLAGDGSICSEGDKGFRRISLESQRPLTVW